MKIKPLKGNANEAIRVALMNVAKAKHVAETDERKARAAKVYFKKTKKSWKQARKTAKRSKKRAREAEKQLSVLQKHLRNSRNKSDDKVAKVERRKPIHRLRPGKRIRRQQPRQPAMTSPTVSAVGNPALPAVPIQAVTSE